MVCFTFFNSFVGSVFWYLFNDVVPEHLLARFMSLFRLVSLLTASVYNFFIFRHAGTHSTQILSGISLLYFFGFGLMCLKVKEGKYPPAPAYVDGQGGGFSAIETFAQECLTLRHYWLGVPDDDLRSLRRGRRASFTLYFYQLTGMSLAQFGRITGMGRASRWPC